MNDSTLKRQQIMSNPCEGPLRRARKEWRDPYSMWGIDDCGRLLDLSATFGGRQTIAKWVIWLWMMVTTAYLWSTARNPWFLGDLDHWALFFSVVYETLSLANGHFQPDQLAGGADGVNGYLKFFWMLFEIAAHLQLLVTFLFWAVVFPNNVDKELTYETFVLHGLVLAAVWIDGMVLNRIPVRVRHYFGVLAVDFIYCVWTIIHFVSGMDNGRNKKTSEAAGVGSDSEAIYLALDWDNELVQTILLTIAILALIAPICFFIQYCMSLFSFPCTWDGSRSRKCIAMGTRDMGMDLGDSDVEKRGTEIRSSRRTGMGDSSRGHSARGGLARDASDRRAPRSNRNVHEGVGNNSETSRTSSRKESSPSNNARPTASAPRAQQRPLDPSIPTTIRTTSSDETTPRRPKTPTPGRPKTPTPGGQQQRPKTPTPGRPKTPTPGSQSTKQKPAPRRASSVPSSIRPPEDNHEKRTKRNKKAGNRPKLNRDLSHMDIL